MDLAVLRFGGRVKSACDCFDKFIATRPYRSGDYRFAGCNSPTDYIVHICKQVMLADRGVGDLVPGGLQAI
jgi:hypothetical protein